MFCILYVRVLYICQNKQRPLPYTSLKDKFFYNRDGQCSPRGTHWNFTQNRLAYDWCLMDKGRVHEEQSI